MRVNKFWNKKDIEYKSNGGGKTLSIKKYLNNIRPYVKDITNFKKSYLCNLTCPLKDNDEERVV